MDALLLQVATHLRIEHESCIGILLYGSFARGIPDHDSDLDIIAVLADTFVLPNSRPGFKFNPDPEVKIEYVANQEVDIFIWSAAMVRSAFSRKHPGNNNLFLNAFTTGRILYDKDGTMQKLVEDARKIRAAGPPAISPKQILLSWMTLKGRLAKIKRMARDPKPAGLFRFLCDSLFEQTLHCYYGSHRRWSAGLDESLKNAHQEDTKLYALLQQYWSAQSAEEFVTALEALIAAAAAPIRHLIDESIFERSQDQVLDIR